MLIAPSILSADFGNLNKDIKQICDGGCDLIHVDIMDGHFVPNLTIGPVVIKDIAKIATKPFDIHLMVENNSFFVDIFAPFNPKYLTFHIEEEKHPHRLIQRIKSLNIKAGVVLNPHTPIEALKYLINDLDIVLIMSVNPGFGGQTFIEKTISKVKDLKNLISLNNSNCLIEVDGGVNNLNVKKLKDVGVDIIVSGSYIFKHKDGVSEAIRSLR